MKYKGYSIYIKTRKRAGGATYLEYRIVPLAGVDWPEEIKRSGQGLRNERLTVEFAQQQVDKVEARAYNLAIGRAVNSEKPIADLFEQFVAWGKVNGGKRRGMGWNEKTVTAAPKVLSAWAEDLRLTKASDIRLVDFEACIARRIAAGHSNSTINNHAGLLRRFTKWARLRKLLADDPLAGWQALDPNSKPTHGTLTVPQLRTLFDGVSRKRRIIYGLAYFCRARRKAIKSLKVRSMDWAAGGFTADYMEIKSRDKKKAFVPVPQPLLGWIWEDCLGRDLDEPLTAISNNNAIRYFRKDLVRLGLPLVQDGLAVTFHGLGAGTATHAAAAGVSEFAIADLMGHSDVDTTRIYLRERVTRIQTAQRPLVIGIYPEMENWHELGTESFESAQAHDLQGGKMERIAGLESPSPRKDNPGTPGRRKENPGKSKNRLIPLNPGTPGKLAYEDGQRILAQVWHRLGDRAFVDFLTTTLDLSPAQLESLAARIPAPAKARA